VQLGPPYNHPSTTNHACSKHINDYYYYTVIDSVTIHSVLVHTLAVTAMHTSMYVCYVNLTSFTIKAAFPVNSLPLESLPRPKLAAIDTIYFLCCFKCACNNQD
jgi:hypothetical protein